MVYLQQKRNRRNLEAFLRWESQLILNSKIRDIKDETEKMTLNSEYSVRLFSWSDLLSHILESQIKGTFPCRSIRLSSWYPIKLKEEVWGWASRDKTRSRKILKVWLLKVSYESDLKQVNQKPTKVLRDFCCQWDNVKEKKKPLNVQAIKHISVHQAFSRSKWTVKAEHSQRMATSPVENDGKWRVTARKESQCLIWKLYQVSGQ